MKVKDYLAICAECQKRKSETQTFYNFLLEKETSFTDAIQRQFSRDFGMMRKYLGVTLLYDVPNIARYSEYLSVSGSDVVVARGKPLTKGFLRSLKGMRTGIQ